MTRTITLLVSVASACALACACATSIPAPAPDSAPPDPAETFAVASIYDLGASVPGEAGAALADITALTAEPDDPSAYLLGAMIARLPGGAVKTALLAVEPFVAAYLNDRLLDWAPDIVGKLVMVGRELGEAAQAVGTSDTVTVAAGYQTAMHAVDGLHYVLDGQTYDLLLASYGLAPIEVPVFDVAFGDGALALGRHDLALPYGQLLRLTLDHAIVPRVDAGATGLLGLFGDSIDCLAVGQDIVAALQGGDATAMALVCSEALAAVADGIYADLDALDDEPLALDVIGVAVAPVGAGGVVDTLSDGTWNGTVSFGSATATLAAGSFTGEREQLQYISRSGAGAPATRSSSAFTNPPTTNAMIAR